MEPFLWLSPAYTAGLMVAALMAVSKGSPAL